MWYNVTLSIEYSLLALMYEERETGATDWKGSETVSRDLERASSGC